MSAVASVWSPTEEQARSSRLWRFMQRHGCASYPELCRRAAEEPRWFWEALVKELGIVWSSPYQDVMDTSAGIPFTRWFPGGRLNAYESAVLRHRKTDPNRLAIIAETESGATRRLTYAELDDAVERTAAGLRAIGVDRGVAVGLYLPLVIENAVALLAITKLGAIAVPLFSGFGAEAIRQRLSDAQARVLITADGATRRGKPVAMKPIAEQAIAGLPHVQRLVVVHCAGLDAAMQPGRDLTWEEIEQPSHGQVATEAMRPDEPWTPEAWEWLFEAVGGGKVPIMNYSGGTECGGGIVSGNFLTPAKAGSFAGPIPGVDAAVFNDAGQPVRGEVGELVIRQPYLGMALGFWNDPPRYLDTYWSRWPNVWVHGDWAMIDEDGLWYILGRSDDTIKVAGKRVGPAEVEAAALDGTEVAEAAAVGIPDPLKGQSVVIFAVARPNADPAPIPAAVSRSVERSLGKPFKPAAVHVIPRLPKTRNGKILRRVIRNVFLGDPPGDLSSIDDMASLDPIRTLGRSSPPADR